MNLLRTATISAGLLIALGEIARWWGQGRFLPMALDELIVGAMMIWAAAAAPRRGPVPLALAWSLFCGFFLSLLVPTLDHLMHGPPKENALLYAALLTLMLLLGAGASAVAIRLSGKPRP